jgi:hypothetical protein
MAEDTTINGKHSTIATPIDIRTSETQAGQRRVNLIWEFTQALIAISMVATIIGATLLQVKLPDSLTNALFVILTFYFGRTNSHLMGGVGTKPTDAQGKELSR